MTYERKQREIDDMNLIAKYALNIRPASETSSLPKKAISVVHTGNNVKGKSSIVPLEYDSEEVNKPYVNRIAVANYPKKKCEKYIFQIKLNSRPSKSSEPSNYSSAGKYTNETQGVKLMIDRKENHTDNQLVFPLKLAKNNINVITDLPSKLNINLPNKSPTLQDVIKGLKLDTKREKEMKDMLNVIQSQVEKGVKYLKTELSFYKIGKVLGKGAFGQVNLGIHKLTGEFVAVKSISKKIMTDETSKNKVMREFSIWERLQHPNIIQLYEVFESEKHLLYIEELCAGGDLLTYVRKRRKLKESVAKVVLKQILEGLNYCHSQSILHRDIKLDNILLNSEGIVKVLGCYKVDM